MSIVNLAIVNEVAKNGNLRCKLAVFILAIQIDHQPSFLTFGSAQHAPLRIKLTDIHSH